MIAVTRRTFRRFRAACARCVVGRTRGPAPPVVIRQAKGCATLTASFPDTTLELVCGTTSTESETLVVPMTALDEIGSTSVELVELEATGALKGKARWPEGVRSKTHPIDLIVPGKQHDPLPRPQELKPVPARFLEALHEAGRTCSRDDGRFALSRVQVKGAKGEVVATDGKVATIFSGFGFPFGEDVLVPALPLFGCPELRDEREVRVGRTKTHLVVGAGDWTAWLVIAPSGKYPDVTGVVPCQAPTRVALDRSDVARLLAELPCVPGMDHENRPVTLDANGCLAVLGYDETTKATKGLELPRCTVTGPSARAVLDRRVLARIFGLGCDAIRLTTNKPLVATGPEVTILAAQLEPALAVPEVPASGPAKDRTPQHRSPNTIPEHQPERSTAMKPHETNGTGNGRREPNHDEPPDPLTAAEELRDALSDVLAKATRLIAALRATRREKKVLATVFNGLKQLNLQPRNGGSS